MKCGKSSSLKLAKAYSVGGNVFRRCERRTKMRILVIESSPHKNGSSNLLADNFIRGARETGRSAHSMLQGQTYIHVWAVRSAVWQVPVVKRMIWRD